MNQDEYAWRAADSLNCQYLVRIYRLSWFLSSEAFKSTVSNQEKRSFKKHLFLEV